MRPDPHFLGQPVKCSPHIDKTGTLYVKLKPTGIVPPSPQESSVSPTQASRSFPPRPASAIPLRKSDIDPTPKSSLPPPRAAEPPKPNTPPLKKPSFLPRVIAAPLSKKKKAHVVRTVGTNTEKSSQEKSTTAEGQSDGTGDRVISACHEEEGRDMLGKVSSLPKQRAIASPLDEVFIGPRLPQTATDTAGLSTPTQAPTSSPKIARVQPQVKPAKPVALVHPVVTDTPPNKVSKVTHIKGLAGKQHMNKDSQVVRPAWKPVGEPSPTTPSTAASSSATTSTPATSDARETTAVTASMAEQKPDTLAGTSEGAVTPPPKAKKRKKHKKKKSHKQEEEEREENERERRHHHRADEKSRKHSTHYDVDEDSDDEGRPRKKRKKTPQHENRKEKKRSRHESHHRREHSSSSDSSLSEREDKGSEQGWHRHGSGRKREREERDGRKHSSSHGDGRKHESSHRRHEGKQHQSCGSSQSVYVSRHESPSPNRSKRKRHWSSDSDDSHSRRKSLKHETHHTPKKHHHSSDHHYHKHHDKGRKSKHAKSVSGTSGTDSKHSHHRSKHEPESDCERDGGHRREGSGSHNTECSEGREGRSGKREEKEVPEVEWDSSLAGRGERGQWDGFRGHDIVDVLTSHTANELGTKGNNTIL